MLQIGSIVDGKYKVLHKIGEGGMSTVYLCINEKANKQWAIKEIRKTGKISSEIILQNLITETEILKKLQHKNLPSIIDVIEQEDTYLMLMDYVEGQTLKKLLDAAGTLPQDDVVGYAIQLCTVLKYLHGQTPPIIYRDMKPANIMLRPDGTIVLIDFGTAREYKEGNDEDTRCLGTRGYAAPEQYGGLGQTDERTDIYNLGATLYQLLTGKNPTRPPYEIKPIRHWDKSLSTGLEKIILKCTKKDPNERYQSIDELKYALEHYHELDTEFQAKKKKQATLFITMCVLSFVLFVGSAASYIYANSIKNGTYNEIIRNAEITVNMDEKIDLYASAIKLDPTREEAYDILLNDIFLEDGTFTQEESNIFTRLLGYKGNNDSQTIEEKFSSNKKGYEKFCFEMGLAYFYYYEDNGNKQLSKPWFNVAKDSQTLPDEKANRAIRFYQISNYYSKLKNPNKAGDNEVSYKDYWNDLVAISSGNIAQEDNIKTALVVYKELTYQIGTHATEFKRAGITKETMENELQMVSDKLSEIKKMEQFSNTDFEMMAEQIENNIRSATITLDSVFSWTNIEEKAGASN